MNSQRTRSTWLGAAGIFVVAAAAHAQWTDDPGTNTPIAVKPGDQAQVKIVAAPDGSTYASWFDNSGSGYDVYLQRIDADGNLVWNADGVLVADRSFSSTQDYGLSIDGQGNAWLAFRDDRFGDVQITVARIRPNGLLLFGADGVQVTNDTAFKAAPRIAAVDADSAVVAWTHDAEARVARVNSAGDVLWTKSITFPANSAALSDVVSAGDGSAIALVVRQGSFADPRQLAAQKFDADGNEQWGNDPVDIFNAGSLQFGNFPSGIATADGGFAVAWYQSSPALQCYAQRLDANGNALLPAGGLPVSTNAAQLRTEPGATFDDATGDLYVFWRETNPLQSQFGVYGQRISDRGARAWGDSGLTIVPLSATNRTQVRATMLEGDAVVAFNEAPAFNQDSIRISRLDAAGSFVWSPTIVTASNVPSGKSRMQLITSANDTAILAWSDNRNDANDIYAQQVTADGALGAAEPNVPGDLNGDGVVNVTDLLLLLGAWGDCTDCGNCLADLNGDCTVNVTDLLLLLANWG